MQLGLPTPMQQHHMLYPQAKYISVYKKTDVGKSKRKKSATLSANFSTENSTTMAPL